MRVEVNAAVWESRVGQNGNMSIRITESRKNLETNSYDTLNSFWANVKGEEAIAAVQAMEQTFANVKAKTERPPFMTLIGYESGRGLKRPDGTYGNGFITFTSIRAFAPQQQNAVPSASAPAPAPVGAPVPTPAPAMQNPVPPAAPVSTGEYVTIPDMGDDEELPFN